MSLNDIWGLPVYVEGIGHIYPIRMKDYEEFDSVADVLRYSKKHFPLTKGQEKDYALLDLIMYAFRKDKIERKLEKLFSLVMRKEVVYKTDGYGYMFLINMYDNKINCINADNYDKFREIVMKQNLVFEHKVFKNKLVQQWAMKVLKAREKNAPKIGIEDMITTVSVYTGKNYDVIREGTIYQLYADFNRVRKMKNYDVSVLAGATGREMDLKDFAEYLDMHKHPYDDLFKKKDDFKNLNKALKRQ